MTPPRHPRVRIASRAGESRLCAGFGGEIFCAGIPSTKAFGAALELEENTGSASPAVIRRFLMLFEVEIHAPSGANPLPPRRGDIVDRKVEQDVEGGIRSHWWTDDFVTLPAPTVA